MFGSIMCDEVLLDDASKPILVFAGGGGIFDESRAALIIAFLEYFLDD
jgi:hypothetical protein